MENLPIIIYNTADGKVNVTLFARDGSVWMNQNQLAELFDTSVPNISMHISNILDDKELYADSVIKYYLTTASALRVVSNLKTCARLHGGYAPISPAHAVILMRLLFFRAKAVFLL